MDIILLEDIEKVGEKHTVVKVKNGYGRNYLIPKGLGIIANGTNMEKLQALKDKEEAAEAAKLGVYQEMADKLEGKTLKIGAKAGTSGKIFGSVTSIQIANALKEQFDIELDRRKINLPEEVKELGTYQVTLDLHKEVQPEVAFEVIAE